MWKFKPFAQKEPSGLEGRIVDVGDVKIHIKNVIAEGGFSSVYLGKDASNPSKQFALKHIICNDQESLDLAKKEISVMKSLKGHPNVVNLYSSAILDMGRTKEALLVMECCDKSLVNVLESRGAGYFDEKQVLTIFRDVCNAVFAMHCHSPPIAHRDLKAENLLLGSDGSWKLCDFGSTSTNHKRFEKPEEMGIEEDVIRKHTTPAYRAPEMWDLYRRDIISEKVDIWALGCLLYRISYFKSAFDGESKLQILNGNYRIPELPKYSAFIIDLIREMLHSSPDLRPDITQVWFRVNEQLPIGSQNLLPDRPSQMRETSSEITEGIPKTATAAIYPMPSRSPPPVPSSSDSIQNISSSSAKSRPGAPAGAFWSTEHAKDVQVKEDKGAPKFDADFTSLTEDRRQLKKQSMPGKAGTCKRENNQATFENDAFNTFVADFDSSKLSPSVPGSKPGKDKSLEAAIESLRGQLKQANLEKAEVTSKYEKLSAICRSQRQELQELKQALAARTPSPKKESLLVSSSASSQSNRSQTQATEGTVWKLQQGLFDKYSRTPEAKSWQPFADDTTTQTPARAATDPPKSVRTQNGNPRKDAPMGLAQDGWGFGNESFRSVPAATSRISRSSGEGNSQCFGDSNKSAGKTASQPTGWAGF